MIYETKNEVVEREENVKERRMRSNLGEAKCRVAGAWLKGGDRLSSLSFPSYLLLVNESF